MSRRAFIVAVAIGAVASACDRGPLAERAGKRQRTLGAGRLPADVHVAPDLPARFDVGRPATAAEIAAWDIDISPDGRGLPSGNGTPTQGAAVFVAKCASCHGANGEGQAGPPPAGMALAPKLVGRDPREGF